MQVVPEVGRALLLILLGNLVKLETNRL